jgi:hypothetical protein
LQSREEDNNRDGKYDELYFEIQVQLLQNQDVHAVTLFLLFDYKLYVCINIIFYFTTPVTTAVSVQKILRYEIRWLIYLFPSPSSYQAKKCCSIHATNAHS